MNQQPELTVKSIFDKIGANRFLKFIFKICLFKTKNPNLQNPSTSTAPLAPSPLTIPPNPTYSLAIRIALRDLLDTITELKREIKELKNSDVFNNQNLSGLIYINEILPSHKYQLYKRTCTYAKSKGYAFIWIQSGNIYVRFNSESNRILILTENDLRALPCLSKSNNSKGV